MPQLFRYFELKTSYRDVPPPLNPLEGLAQQHAGRNIRSADFHAFTDALIETVAAIDPELNHALGDDDPIRRAWRAVLDPGTRYLEARVADLTQGAAG